MLNRGAWAAALIAVATVSLIALTDLVNHGLDVTRFLRVGEEASARPFVTEDIPDTHLVSGWGHDGQANYVIAATFPDLEVAEGHLDSVTYRARRVVYPALLAGVPRGRPLVYGMLALNLAAVAAAAGAVAALARDRGASPLAGAIVGVTPAFVASVVISLGDALALATVAWGYLAWSRGDPRGRAAAVTLFTLAALTRETTLVVPLALIAASFTAPEISSSDRGRHNWMLTVPLLIALTWIALLEVWIGGPGKSAAQFTLPFAGWFATGFDTTEIMIAASFVVLSGWLAHRIRRSDPAWAIVLVVEAAMLCCVERGVLFDTLNLARVTPWLMPWVAIALLADGHRRDVDRDDPAGDRSDDRAQGMAADLPIPRG